jgi:hypothetical protein
VRPNNPNQLTPQPELGLSPVLPPEEIGERGLRVFPSNIETAAPEVPVLPARHLEYPVPVTLTDPSLVIPPREPTNDSPLALPVFEPTGKADVMLAPPSERQMHKSIHGLSVPPALAQEIEQALEMMRRVSIAHLAQGKGVAMDPPGNKYQLPKPLVYPVSRSSDRE